MFHNLLMPCSKILSWRHKRCILRPFIRPLYPTYFWNFKKCLNYQNCFGCWTFLKSISQKMVHTSKISISPIHQNFHMVHNSQNFHVTHSPKFSYLWDGSQLHPAFLAGQPWPRPPPVHLHRPWLRPSRDLQTGTGYVSSTENRNVLQSTKQEILARRFGALTWMLLVLPGE